MLEFNMPKGVSDKVTFKLYDVGQGELIPPTVDELIPANHLVRIVNSTYVEGTKIEARANLYTFVWSIFTICYVVYI